MLANDVTELIGNTPIVSINRVNDGQANVYGKVEGANPGSSVKDRIGLAIIEAAEASGQLQPGGTIVEATSGNTGVALAMVGAARGYHVVLTMPESMSHERRSLARAFGAELVLTPAAEGMQGTVDAANKIVAERKGAILASQFKNPANPKKHSETTAVEILNDLDGKVDIFVAGVGTGGTVSGVGRVIKERNPEAKVIAVEHAESPLLSGGKAGPHKIQGIGANFVPENYDESVIDEVITVKSEDAIATTRRLAQEEGLLVGISAGANVYAAVELSQKSENKGKTIVTILCDTGERYLSTPVFAELAED